ncbi:MAG: amidohydrolase [Dehalococcoidia bacterium]|nr:amidohydrolase [Dehalococcoidia bacterium]
MPKTGNAWLALTTEETLEPELPICDPHHHLWDRRTTSGPYQRYLLDELLEDIGSGHNVRSTVFVEADSMLRASGPEEMKPVGEVEFVQGVAAASASGIYGDSRVAAAIVGSADLNLGDGVRPVLEALQAASPNRFRGIRHRVPWDPHPDMASSAPQGQLLDTEFRAGAGILASMGLSFEGWMYFHQLPELADLAQAVPDLAIVLNHIGGPLRVGPYAGKDDEVIPTWKEGISAVAACPNVVIKLGGVGMPIMGFDWHARETPVGSEELAEGIAPFMEYCIEQFGPDRCMFESNFPVDKASFSYHVMYNAFKRLSKAYSASERAAMFHDNAVRVYRISDE